MPPHDNITVKAGNYAEQLTIETDGISLVGQKGTILTPLVPAIPAKHQTQFYGTAGPGTIAGICVIGQNVVVQLYPGHEHSKVNKGDVGKYVKNVSITGFEIVLNGTEKAIVKENKLIDGDVYEGLAAGSRNSYFQNDEIISTGSMATAGKLYNFRAFATCYGNLNGVNVQ
ncbi:hypothetical protein BJ878DRAFT_556177 [Calycina marina]|uniref:Uncharacterized protein n=1 Tax=Calycina marina TaxID=1763456 RepID=A0A9P7YYA9_9HELO|nr:hypothetical protein BJ878DRAFT_556177 [Calycina marina]